MSNIVIKNADGTEIKFNSLSRRDRSEVLRTLKRENRELLRDERREKNGEIISDITSDPLKMGLAVTGIVLGTVALTVGTYFIVRTIVNAHNEETAVDAETAAEILGGADVY